MFIQVALPQPLRLTFDYFIPPTLINQWIAPGMRVKVPWGTRELIGVVMGVSLHTSVASEKLRPIKAILDTQPIITPAMMQFCLWAAEYYHHAIGETIALALPPYLRKNADHKTGKRINSWELTQEGLAVDPGTCKRSPKQAAALVFLRKHGKSDTASLHASDISELALKALHKKGWIEKTTHYEDELAYSLMADSHIFESAAKPELNSEQHLAIQTICQCLQHFQPFILDGVTGSGKTEVYLQVIEQVILAKKQALVLVPEIGLTPQTVARFQSRFPETLIAIFHSNLSEIERLKQWSMAQKGLARIIIGTRSALFTPMPELGLIIIDEAHDASFKQQEGLRYSARDLAMKRGQLEKIPVVLGSATHTLETLFQIKNQRYTRLWLTKRAGNAMTPTFEVVDMRHQKLISGLAPKVGQAITEHLNANNQVLIFLNRRGFAPVLLCHDCGWIAGCARCDARLTLHYDPYQLHCHHCDVTHKVNKTCPKCQSAQLITRGAGTERIEQLLKQQHPHIKIARIDKDTTRQKLAMQNLLDDIHAGHHQLLIGTQMLAKGHHFPNVTLVVILDVDYGFCSNDFRASERLAQLIVQVAGRAGRAEKKGHVMLQTHHPDHPLLQILLHQGYNAFADAALIERETAGLPPASNMAVIRAEASHKELAVNFLQQVKETAQSLSLQDACLIGPMPTLMERRAGLFRWQLIIQTAQKNQLQQALKQLVSAIDKLKLRGKVRWHVDVDPWDIL